MAYNYQPPQQPQYSAQNLQFYPSSYGVPPSDPSQGRFSSPYGSGGAQQAQQSYPSYDTPTGFMSSANFGPSGQGVSGRMGEQGGLRTGWLAAFGTEGYDGEPPLLEELGVNFGHIKVKVSRYERSETLVFGHYRTRYGLYLSLYRYASLQPLGSLTGEAIVRNMWNSELTIENPDPHSTEPFRAHRPTYNGRLRPLRPRPLLPPVWLLSPLQWQGPLRLHLRTRPRRRRLPTHNLLAHVQSAPRHGPSIHDLPGHVWHGRYGQQHARNAGRREHTHIL